MDEALKRIREAKETRSAELNLSKCFLHSVPEEITELPWLTHLDLSGNDLEEFPLQVLELKNLTSLKLGKVNEIGYRSFEIMRNSLKILPKEIVELKNLTQLDLRNTQLYELPKEIFELKNLTQLDLRNTQLSELPKEIVELKNLTRLDLSDNQLSELPKEIFEFKSLTQLYLSGNQLSELPKGIFELKNLTQLYLRNTQLSELPKEIVELKNLTQLYLSYNNLSELPKEIFELKNLTQLDLRYNELSELPKEIFELKNLTQLDLSDNQLSELPKEIFELKNLTQLDLRYNNLSELPKEIFELKNLTQLDLRYNNLLELSKEIVELKNLIEIELYGNPLENPPIEIANKGIDEIRNYFKSVEQGSKKLYEAKLIIVGQGGVGKTCLMQKIKDNNWQVNPNEPSTEGIAVEQWNWNLTDGKDKEFKVNIWDFGGQEIYHSTHQFFLTKRSLYIFVWAARKEESYASFDYWLNIVKLLSNQSPVIVVLNKADERIKEIDQASLKEKFSNIAGFHKVSCLTGIGIEELTRQIKEEIAQLPHVGTKWPNVWTKIRHTLEQDGRDYIDCTEYYEICSKFELDEEKASYLSSFLHDLGVILHFQDDDILRNIVILKPEWGTNAVYRVLDTKSVMENKGRFTLNDLRTIWEKTKYPTNKHIELVQLMIKFELCFKLSDKDEYIVPELLEDKRPDSIVWNDKDNIKFEYHYDFMPDGIISRFIARNHFYIEDNIYWKSGAILTFQNSRALVVSEKLNKKMKISIEGINNERLLSIIRKEFDHIHKTLKLKNPDNLVVKEMIPCICNECISGKNPQFYSVDVLERYISRNKGTIECQNSLEDISVNDLYSIINGRIPSNSDSKNDIFISYSHEDNKYFNDLKVHLVPYERNMKVIPWHDKKLNAGDLWFEEIKKALDSAKVGVFLVSPDFLASEFIHKHELTPLLEKAKKRGVSILWVAVRPSAYDQTELKDYQCANEPDKPLSTLTRPQREQQYVNICKKIEYALKK